MQLPQVGYISSGMREGRVGPVGEPQRPVTILLASAMDDMRKAADVLRASKDALAARPSRKSNISGFVRFFVLSRRPTAADTAVESFRADLERARDHFATSAATLADVFAGNRADPALERLHVELTEAAFDGILSSLQFAAMPEGQAQRAEHLAPVIARLRICEGHTLHAIRQLALQARAENGDGAQQR
jgi:hypothetical protein